jgi:hypothetical protein
MINQQIRKFLTDFQGLIILALHSIIALLSAIYIVVRIDSSKAQQIVAYRPGYGYEGYKLGSSAELYAFAVLAVVLFFVIPVLGFRLHARGKNFPLILYFFSTIILCFNFVVAKALLQ